MKKMLFSCALIAAALLVACSGKKPSESLTQETPATATAATSLADAPTIEAVSAGITAAVQAGDTAALNQLLPAGMYLCVREGTMPFLYQHISGGALLRKHATWLTDSLKSTTCTPAVSPIPSFECIGFSRKGCFIGDAKKFNLLTRTMRTDNKEQLATFSKEEMEAAAKAEAETTHLLLFTAARVAFYLTRLNNKWQIIAADVASYSCDA